MQIPVRDLTAEGRPLDETTTLEGVGLVDSGWHAAAVRVHGYLDRMPDDEIHVEGAVEVDLKIECARCLAPFEMPVEGEFEVYFQEVAEGDERALESPDPAIEFFDGHRIDLAGVVRDAIVLSVPGRSLCRDDCRGLCPRCGADLNAGPCECPQGVGDDNPFARFFDRQAGRESP